MITTLVVIFLGLVALAGVLYFFKPKKLKKAVEGGSGSENKWKVPQFAKDWWNNLDKESSPGQRFVVLVLALLAAYIEFSIRGSVWVALIGLLIAAIYKPPKSKITWAFVILDLVVLIAAAFLPGVAEMRHTSYEIAKVWSSQEADKLACYEARLQKEPYPLPPGCLREKAANVSAPQAIVPAVYQPQTQTLQVVPGGGFRKVNIPPGRVLKDLTWDCPDGCILEIVHEGQPLCSTEEKDKYQGQPCGVVPVEVGGSGVQRYREQFVTPYGHFISFPRDIAVVGVAFGTDENLGTIKATATITL